MGKKRRSSKKKAKANGRELDTTEGENLNTGNSAADLIQSESQRQFDLGVSAKIADIGEIVMEVSNSDSKELAPDSVSDTAHMDTEHPSAETVADADKNSPSADSAGASGELPERKESKDCVEISDQSTVKDDSTGLQLSLESFATTEPSERNIQSSNDDRSNVEVNDEAGDRASMASNDSSSSIEVLKEDTSAPSSPQRTRVESSSSPTSSCFKSAEEDYNDDEELTCMNSDSDISLSAVDPLEATSSPGTPRVLEQEKTFIVDEEVSVSNVPSTSNDDSHTLTDNVRKSDADQSEAMDSTHHPSSTEQESSPAGQVKTEMSAEECEVVEALEKVVDNALESDETRQGELTADEPSAGSDVTADTGRKPEATEDVSARTQAEAEPDVTSEAVSPVTSADENEAKVEHTEDGPITDTPTSEDKSTAPPAATSNQSEADTEPAVSKDSAATEDVSDEKSAPSDAAAPKTTADPAKETRTNGSAESGDAAAAAADANSTELTESQKVKRSGGQQVGSVASSEPGCCSIL